MAAQASHASLVALINKGTINHFLEHGKYPVHYATLSDKTMDWFKQGQTKICVGVNSEKELWEIYQAARKLKVVPCSIITDAGYTEFHGVPTKTAVAIGPWDAEVIDEITGHLKLL